jgi:VanZ family protein
MTTFFARHPFIRNQLPALAWAALISVASSVPGDSIPDMPILSQDKLIHFGIYLLLAWLTYRAFRRQTRFPGLTARAGLATLAVVAFYGMVDELHQLFVPGRSCDIYDWMSDMLGGFVLVLIMSTISWYRGRKDGSPDPD